ncbi:hypothetical protein AA23498_0562 [Acetobacter nitrogenifigens DSM 23921 = NBRC 105050]|uniref:Uncharacterized protein n=1 Tax=Acetobacter nitrogenifigens DSM 23921 = NBRC 105050 TaxID=1120919 RepID=A0A511X814_9PROT|nr:hypothetical protein AA23498_0562 [Acetobacter nitrogenifigens DSM 23921 = NBRC 105050]GEN59084.1 hypothetical protein ANI02nite_09680 [Acetobacter nitrogenifigens DSM 23921 = NBRC 105050]
MLAPVENAKQSRRNGDQASSRTRFIPNPDLARKITGKAPERKIRPLGDATAAPEPALGQERALPLRVRPRMLARTKTVSSLHTTYTRQICGSAWSAKT